MTSKAQAHKDRRMAEAVMIVVSRVAANPGCSKSDAAVAAIMGISWSHGMRAVNAAIDSGFIVCKRSRRQCILHVAPGFDASIL